MKTMKITKAMETMKTINDEDSGIDEGNGLMKTMNDGDDEGGGNSDH